MKEISGELGKSGIRVNRPHFNIELLVQAWIDTRPDQLTFESFQTAATNLNGLLFTEHNHGVKELNDLSSSNLQRIRQSNIYFGLIRSDAYADWFRRLSKYNFKA